MKILRKLSQDIFNKMSIQKLVNPSAERNKGPILEIVLKNFNNEIQGSVLEISSGTGQHIAYIAPHYPNLIFQPSEYDISMLPHIKSYIDSCVTKNIKNPLHIDIRIPYEKWGLDTLQYDYMININMIHISPFTCTEGLFRNAGLLLKPNGLLLTYGAYAKDGVIEPQSNIEFDKSLRRQNPDWGVRDINLLKEVAFRNGIQFSKMYDMPANNKCVIWNKLN